jgi:phage terminase large subunit-like protein
MADIVKDAGISRAQALEAMFSTFGDNPDGWGKEQWDFGEQVNAGGVKIDNFFHASYHCPQDLTPRQARKDPERYIRMANPALGHTVGLEEFLPTFWSVIDSPSKWSTFAYQRLMIWQHASITWLPPDLWPKCGGHSFSDEELKERPCVLGLDLAQKRDLAACIPVWKNADDGVDISHAMFWCNQERIDQIAGKFPRIREFVEAGLIRVNEGDVTDMRIIKNDIREFCLSHNVRGIVYDAKYAEWMIQQLVSGELDPEGRTIIEGLPIGEQSISQGIMTQTGPVVDFENGLRSGIIRHDDNPVLAWQFGHASVFTDKQGNRRIMKDNQHSHKTVDGCQAAVMARWGAVDFSEWHVTVLDFYENNAVEMV